MNEFLKALARNEAGVTMIEYALMLLLVAVACIGTVTLFGARVAALFAQASAVI